MNKIIAAFDGLRFSESTRDYAVSLAKANGTQLEGLFLEDRTYHSYNLYDLITEDAGGMATKRSVIHHK